MAFALIHYISLISAVALFIATAAVGKKYASNRNPLTLVFVIFILLFAVSMLLNFSKGFFEPAGIEDALLSKAGLSLGLIVTALFSSFLLYPLSVQYRETTKQKIILVVMAAMWLLAGYAAFILGTLEIEFTGVVDGASNFRMPMAILGVIIFESFVNIGILLLVVLREKDPTFRTRTLILLVGYTIFITAEMIDSIAHLAVIVPLVSMVGLLTMTYGILRE
ncbi:MAG: membrane protein of unknown function [Candidatus Thorarchaeota archaeon]|nr:MAG: membrane protein of unknown function [Candidatus Thorarchaeota archaeon]